MHWAIENINNQYIAVRTFGKYDLSDHHKMIEGLLSQDYWRSGTPIIYDHRELDVRESHYETVEGAARYRKQYDDKLGDTSAAIVVSSDLMFGIFRQFNSVVDGHITGTPQIFRSYEEAEAWIQE